MEKTSTTKHLNPCVFLDRDGVINADRVDYVYRMEEFILLPSVPEALQLLKKAGYLIIVITNQSGIAKGIYTEKDVWMIHDEIQKRCGHAIDALYFSPHHPSHTTESLTRKPGSLMMEKAMAKYRIDPSRSWMVGDNERDIIPAKKLGIGTVLISETEKDTIADFRSHSLFEAVLKHILANHHP